MLPHHSETKAYHFNVDVHETKFAQVKTWTIKDPTSKLLHIRLVFKNAGQAFEKKRGALQLLNSADFGAGSMDAYHFQEFLMNHQLLLHFKPSNDDFVITLQTPPENLKYGLQALTLILTQLKIEAGDFKRAQESLLLSYEQAKLEPRSLAEDHAKDFLYDPHPYLVKCDTMIGAIKTLTIQDLKNVLADHLTQDRLCAVVLGNYDAKAIESFMQSIKALCKPVSDLPKSLPTLTLRNQGKTKFFPMKVPQSIVLFAMKAIPATHPDAPALYLFNSVLGGNNMTSRLWSNIREDRGLAYFVKTMMPASRYAEALRGIMGTGTDQVDQAIKITKETIHTIISKGITEKELNFEKRHLTGEFLTAFDSLEQMSAVLGSYITDFNLDQLKEHNHKIVALSLKEVNRVAKEYLNDETITFCILGNHE